MKEIEFKHPHRKKHFDFFNHMNHPHFCLCADVQLHDFLNYCKYKNMSLYHALVYVVSRSANEIEEFRWRIRDQKVYEHPEVHPSFAVKTNAADVFSFCTVAYSSDSDLFLKNAKTTAEKMMEQPSFEDEEGRDDFLFLSSLPWVKFTSLQHAMMYHPTDSVPRISWGKIETTNKVTLMPLSVQVHHAVVDGRHVGRFYQKVEAYFRNPDLAFLS